MAAAVTDSALTARRRESDLAALRAVEVDVLVVGGGITGAGVALDAATRGLTVALVERHDLASVTSRWSSKLAHGGLRYIAAGQLGVAWESAVERNYLVRSIAPHLIQPMRFIIPALQANGLAERGVARLGFGIADTLRWAARTPSQLPKTSWVSPSEAHALTPTLRRDIRGGFLHVDGSLEDDARLVVAVARTAAAHGARIITHCAAVDVNASGATVSDSTTGERFDIRARSVVVAAGVWSGGLVDRVPLQPSKGAHVLIRPEALGNPTAAFNILVPGTRNRYVFAVPRPDGLVQIGLTDDAVDEVVDEPAVTDDDEKFLLDTLSSGLDRPVTSADVVGKFAGLRPLLGTATGSTAADISRRHALLDREGVLVIVGGKLTTYRRMAQDAVYRVCKRLGHDGSAVTRTLPLVGAVGGADAALPGRLRRRFGAEAGAVAECGPLEPVAPGLPALKCEVGWSIAAEGALDVADIERRLRLDVVPEWRDAARGYLEETLSSSG